MTLAPLAPPAPTPAGIAFTVGTPLSNGPGDGSVCELAVSAAQVPAPAPLQVAGVRVINCNACHVNKPETDYPFKNKATGRRSTKCKPCMRAYAKAHYEANKPARIAAANQRNVLVRAETRAEVASLLDGVLCGVCEKPASQGNDLVVVLPADEKTASLRLSQLIDRGWALPRIQALVVEATASGSVLCRRCLGDRCGAQNRQSVAARERAFAYAAAGGMGVSATR